MDRPSREQMLADLQKDSSPAPARPSREQMLAELSGSSVKHAEEDPSDLTALAGRFARNTLGSATAAVNGVANGVTFGYLPQIEGALSAAPSVLSGDPDVISEDYLKARDHAVAYQKSLQDQYPLAYIGGNVGGAIALPIPGSGIKATSTMGKLAVAAGKGAAFAGLANPGDTEGVIDPLQLEAREHNAKVGAVVGAGGHLAAESVSALPDKFQTIRRWMAAKQLGANKRQVEKLLQESPEGNMKLDDVEKYMDEHGMLGLGTTFSDVADKSGELVEQQGKKIGGIYQNVQGKINANPEFAQEIADTALHGPDLANDFVRSERLRLGKLHGGAAAADSVERAVGNPENPVGLTGLGGDVSLPELQKYRTSVDNQIPWNADTTGKLTAESNIGLRSYLNQKIQDRVAAADPGSLGDLLRANQSYSTAKTINEIAQKTKAGEMSKFAPGLVGALGGLGVGYHNNEGGGGLLKSTLMGTAVGFGLRGARAVAPAMSYQAAKALQPASKKAAEYIEEHPEVGSQLAAPWVQMFKEEKKK